MRALQYFPTIEDPNARRALFEVLAFLLTFQLHLYKNVWTTNDIIVILQVLQRILMGTDVVKNVNKNNASHAVLFEALALVSLH
jgi:AP-2 complex subunit alpha